MDESRTQQYALLQPRISLEIFIFCDIGLSLDDYNCFDQTT